MAAETMNYALTKLLSKLVARDVSFTIISSPAPTKARLLYGVYVVLPSERAMVVKAELATLALLGGALVGLPEDTAIERAQATPMDETMRDAIHEVLNVASTALSSEHRVVFRGMFLDPVYCQGEASDLLRSAPLTRSFHATVQGSSPGLFTVLSGL